MPWSVGDVDKHKKGLTSEQKKKWVGVANGVYKSCIDGGGTDKTCAPRAIKVANSKFSIDNSEESKVKAGKSPTNKSEDFVMRTETQKVPVSALSFVQDGSQASIFDFKDGDATKPKLDMTIYSGKTIKGHWYWDDLVIDLEGMKVEKKKIPILEEHNPQAKIAYSAKPIVTEDGALKFDPEKTVFVDTPESVEFQKLSKEGFPYESSLSGRPSKIQRLMEKEEAEVNGFTFKGPGTIWREWVFKEGSVCVFGYDSNTQSRAFTDKTEELKITFLESGKTKEPKTKVGEEEVSKMTLDEFKKDHPELFKEVTLSARKEIEIEFKAKEDQWKTELALRDEKLLSLEKKEAIRTEMELKQMAVNLFSQKLSASSIDPCWHEKIIGFVPHTKFVKDGVLNVEDFTKAVDAEIKDWETKTAQVKGQILGSVFIQRTDITTNLSDENKMALERLQKASGMEIRKPN